MSKEMPEKALEAYHFSLHLALYADSTNMVEYCAYYEISKCLFSLGRTKEAIGYIKLALTQAKHYQVKRKEERIIQITNHLIQFYIADNQLDQAKLMVDQLIELVEYQYQGEPILEAAKFYKIAADLYLKEKGSNLLAITEGNASLKEANASFLAFTEESMDSTKTQMQIHFLKMSLEIHTKIDPNSLEVAEINIRCGKLNMELGWFCLASDNFKKAKTIYLAKDPNHSEIPLINKLIKENSLQIEKEEMEQKAQETSILETSQDLF
jgi:tetratricopeptide (TPR) repeat protein